MGQPPDTNDALGGLERVLGLAREALIIFGAIFLIIYFFPAIRGLRGRLSAENIEGLSVGPISLKLNAHIASFAPSNITLEAVSGPAIVLEKGSAELLSHVRDQLRATKGARIDALLIVPGKIYDSDLLRQYLSLLSARFVLFQGTRLEGWIDASAFAAQLEPHRTYDYERLTTGLVGISSEVANKRAPAKQVLEQMQRAHVDNVAVIDDAGRFQFMASRQEILARVVSSVLLGDTATAPAAQARLPGRAGNRPSATLMASQ